MKKRLFFGFVFFSLFGNVFSQGRPDLMLDFSSNKWVIVERRASLIEIEGEKFVARKILKEVPQTWDMYVYSKDDFRFALENGVHRTSETMYIPSSTPPFFDVRSRDYILKFDSKDLRFFSENIVNYSPGRNEWVSILSTFIFFCGLIFFPLRGVKFHSLFCFLAFVSLYFGSFGEMDLTSSISILAYLFPIFCYLFGFGVGYIVNRFRKKSISV